MASAKKEWAGKKVPAKTEMVAVRMPAPMMKRVRALAAQNETTLAAIFRHSIEKFLAGNPVRREPKPTTDLFD